MRILIALLFVCTAFAQTETPRVVPSLDALAGANVNDTTKTIIVKTNSAGAHGGTYYWNATSAAVTDGNRVIGSTRTGTGRWLRIDVSYYSGAGSPEGVVDAPKGSIYARSDGGSGSALYVKETAIGNTSGWKAWEVPSVPPSTTIDNFNADHFVLDSNSDFAIKSNAPLTNAINKIVSTGSTTARSIQDRTAEVRNVLDYGFDPTGASDNDAAFLAMQAAIPNRSTVVFPNLSGTADYRFNSVIISKDLEIIGTGLPKITHRISPTGPMWNFTARQTGKITGLFVDGNGAATMAISTNGWQPQFWYAGDGGEITGNIFTNYAKAGIYHYGRGSTSFSVTKNLFVNGVEIAMGATAENLALIFSFAVQINSIEPNAFLSVKVNHNIFKQTSYPTLRYPGSTVASADAAIGAFVRFEYDGNYHENIGPVALYEDGWGFSIRNNYFTNWTFGAIAVENSRSGEVVNNEIYASTSSYAVGGVGAAVGAAIAILPETRLDQADRNQHVLVANNRLYGNLRTDRVYGIGVRGGAVSDRLAHNVTISGNMVTNYIVSFNADYVGNGILLKNNKWYGSSAVNHGSFGNVRIENAYGRVVVDGDHIDTTGQNGLVMNSGVAGSELVLHSVQYISRDGYIPAIIGGGVNRVEVTGGSSFRNAGGFYALAITDTVSPVDYVYFSPDTQIPQGTFLLDVDTISFDGVLQVTATPENVYYAPYGARAKNSSTGQWWVKRSAVSSKTGWEFVWNSDVNHLHGDLTAKTVGIGVAGNASALIPLTVERSNSGGPITQILKNTANASLTSTIFQFGDGSGEASLRYFNENTGSVLADRGVLYGEASSKGWAVNMQVGQSFDYVYNGLRYFVFTNGLYMPTLTGDRILQLNSGGKLEVNSFVDTTEVGYLNGVSANIQTQIDGKMTSDTDLVAIAGLATTGVMVRTGSGTATTRTLTGNSEIVIADGDGVAGAPTFSIAASMTRDTELAGYQPLDAELTAVAGVGSNGLLARTGAGAVSPRTITGDSEITVSNGDGASGNPTLAIASTLTRDTELSAYVPVAGATTITGAKTFSSAILQPIDTIGASDVDWSTGNVFFKSISGNTTFTFSGATAGQWITVKVTAAGANTVTWPTVTWKAAATPSQTSTKTDFYTFFYDGTTYYGAASQNY